MNYRHLEYFVKVVQRGSIKDAAERLGVSQPAISAAIQNLEDEFGAKLLDRRREGSVPTVYGKSLYDSAITMGSMVENARQKIAALKDPSLGQLRVGTGPSVSIDHVSTAVAEYVSAYPNVQVEHVTGTSYETFEKMLVVEDIDIALCHVPEHLLPKSLDWKLISPNPIGALVAAAHIGNKALSLSSAEMMANYRWITPRDDVMRPPDGIELPSDVTGRRSPITVVAQDLQLIKKLTLTTKSIGFLPLHMTERELQSGELVRLNRRGVKLMRPIYALTRPAKDPLPLIERFLDLVGQIFKKADQSLAPHKTIRLVQST